jgi:hypothetical protein
MQWKFPLVSELVQSIVALNDVRTMLGQRSIVQHTMFKYGKDESLILYLDHEKTRMDLIKPYHTAQVGFNSYINLFVKIITGIAYCSISPARRRPKRFRERCSFGTSV